MQPNPRENLELSCWNLSRTSTRTTRIVQGRVLAVRKGSIKLPNITRCVLTYLLIINTGFSIFVFALEPSQQMSLNRNTYYWKRVVFRMVKFLTWTKLIEKEKTFVTIVQPSSKVQNLIIVKRVARIVFVLSKIKINLSNLVPTLMKG